MKALLSRKIQAITRMIKESLSMVIPILFTGSITVLLNSFPIMGYQDFLDSFMGGALRNILQIVQVTTVGVLAVYLTVALNLSYTNRIDNNERLVFRFGSLMTCLAGFFILVGFTPANPDFNLLGGQGVFCALLAGLIGSALYRKFEVLFEIRKNVFVDGADSIFNAALHVILPFTAAILCIAAANYLITVCFSVESVRELFTKVVNAIFSRMDRGSYGSGLLYTVLVGVMWWFGIHGNKVLNQVETEMFAEIIPGQIVSKSFMDTFVIMGGTGCLIGLLLAMIIFGRRSSTKKLSKIAFLPCVFNISELLVFGFPVIYNPSLALPFVLAPALCYTNAFILTSAGFLPFVTTSVEWTTPPLMGGYIATESVRGIIVQLINIVISAACYAPFLIMYEKRSLKEFSSAMGELVGICKKSEESGKKPVLTDCEGNTGRFARLLATDLGVSLSESPPEHDTEKTENPLIIEYPQQFDEEGNCIGAEACLKWKHALYGDVETTIVMCLAGESGDLYGLETYILEKAIRRSAGFRQNCGENFTMYVNVTDATLCDKRFISFLQTMAIRYKLKAGNICIKTSPESGSEMTEETREVIKRMQDFGYYCICGQ